jgi:hypothetical protein
LTRRRSLKERRHIITRYEQLKKEGMEPKYIAERLGIKLGSLWCLLHRDYDKIMKPESE